uniref:Integrase, catalytic region, zinc finger, CCHC-type, peptidase aspartic, catalytic n=1 Tax=Tanacetum cinerariifolium TaxID=118510 RepID=A0A6L2P2Q8_TANCI|nr:integrase, catalytic region, zinc finger, CCHC-type, peptidase aspartic, catalytic [Tanacetum cinerariifolium]
MSRDVLTVGSTMRIPLLYRGEYSQWIERFMNYLEEQTDGETMINSIKNGNQPLPSVTQVSNARTSSTEQPPLKDKSMRSDQEKKIQKIVRLARSLLIQGLPNDIYSLIDSNKNAKDLWDALARHMLGSEYGEQDRKAAVLYEYETFKTIEGELLLDIYIQYLQVINDLKKCGYSKGNCELNFKFLNNLQPKWKLYATMMRQNKNLMDINIDALYNILKQNQGYVNDAMGLKKKTIEVTSDPLALIAEKTNVSKRKEKVVVSSDFEGSDADDFSELKKITALLAKAFNRRKFYSKPTNNNLRTSSTSQFANKKQEFVKMDDKKVEKKDDEKKRDMSKVECYNCKKEGNFAKDCKKVKVNDYEYYKTKMLLAKKDKDEQVLLAEDQAWMESSSDSDQEKNANMVFMAQIKKVLSDSETSSSSADDKIFEVSYYLSESESESEYETSKYYDNTTTYGYTLMFLTHSDEALEIEKFKRARENKIEFAYDHGIFNGSYVNEKIKFLDDYFQEIISPDFEKIDSLFQQTSSLKPYVSTVILEKIIIDLEEEVVSPLEKEKPNLETTKSSKSRSFESSENGISKSENQSENDCQVIEKEYTLSSVRRPKHSSVVWKKKGLSNTSNVDLSSVSHSKLNKDVKQYSRKDLLSCNNSHLGETSSAYVCNDAMNVFYNSRLCDSFDENNLFIFDDESVRISHVSKMPFRKKPCNSLNIVYICLWIIDSGCSKHMTGNRALFTNFGEKFLGTVCFGNNDFAVIARYGDVVIGSMTIKKVYYVEGLGHNLFSFGQFCNKGLKVAFRKSTCFVQNEDGVDLLTGDRSSNLYTIALNEVASNSSTCLLANDSSSKS